MPRFERSELTKSLVRYLAQHEKGARVTYSELSEAVGTAINSCHASLISARRILERESVQVWCCVPPNVGVWRLTDPEIAQRQRDWYLYRARNQLNAGASQADTVELDELSIDQQSRFAVDSIIRELGREALSKATQRRVRKGCPRHVRTICPPSTPLNGRSPLARGGPKMPNRRTAFHRPATRRFAPHLSSRLHIALPRSATQRFSVKL